MIRAGTLLAASMPLLLAAGAGAEERVQRLSIGEKAPDFRLPAADGKTYALEDFAKAKVLAVIFTCNHCPSAQAYEERLKKLVADYGEKGVTLVAISPNDPAAVRLDELGYTDLGDSLEEMKIRAKDRAFNFPYLYDGEDQKVSRAYGPAATPHAFLFDAERKLRYAGRIDDAEKEASVKTRELRDGIDALLAGKPVPVESTKTFGCSIKWSEKRESVKDSIAKSRKVEARLEPISSEGIVRLVANKAGKPADGKLRLINVWATSCGPCVKEFPSLVTLPKMYGHRAFELVTISADGPDKKEKVLAFLEKQEASGTHYLYDQEKKDGLLDAIDKAWSGAIPYTILVRPDGKVVYRQEGEIDPLKVRRAIVKNLADDR